MTREERTRVLNIAKALQVEEELPEGWFWLSFCDPERPRGEQFLGVSVVRGRGIATAVKESHARGCNPGGEVYATAMPVELGEPPDTYANMLLNRAQVDALRTVWPARRDRQ